MQIRHYCGCKHILVRYRRLRGTTSLSGDGAVWDHLAGMVSTPFEASENRQIAVKMINDRGNKLLVVKDLKKAEE